MNGLLSIEFQVLKKNILMKKDKCHILQGKLNNKNSQNSKPFPLFTV